MCGVTWSALRSEAMEYNIKNSLDYLKLITSHGFYQIPGFILVDIARLLEHGYDVNFFSDKLVSDVPEINSANKEDFLNRKVLRMRYESEFLNRLLQLPKFHELVEIVQTSNHQHERIKRILVIFSESLKRMFPNNLKVNPIIMRELRIDTINNVVPKEELNQEIAIWLETFLKNISKNMLWSDLIEEQDIFEIGHWERLNTKHARLGCRQIITLQKSLPKLELRKLQINETETEIETCFIDHTYVPSGGVAELTNRGSIENLVASELLYIDENHQGLNLFDLRYIEGELLYYMRDEGALLRKRRSLFFIVDLDSSLHVKPISYDYQISILVQALMLKLYQDFTNIFENDSIQANFNYISRNDNQAYLEDEAELLKILLIDDIKHGQVKFDIGNEINLAWTENLTQKPYIIIFTERADQYWTNIFEEKLPDYSANMVQITISSSSTVNPNYQINPDNINNQSIQNLCRDTIQQILL